MTSNIDLASRTDYSPAADENSVTMQMLQYVRLTVHAKCVGLTQENAGVAPIPTSPLMTIAGLVNHVRWVEAFWIDFIFLGGTIDHPGTDDDPDREMRIAPEFPLEQLLAEYAEQAARTDDILRATDWDTWSAKKNKATGEGTALRWIVNHLIEETARHNGHIDIIRELVDGVTGD
jgi:uncharacterized damage-inducible protein DinB